MSAGRYCGSCGAPHGPGVRFCGSCGAQLGIAAPTPPPAPPVAIRVSRRGPPWKRVVAGVLALALVALAIAVVGPQPPPDEGPRLGLGAATSKDPTPARIVSSATWGRVPADQILVLLRDGLGRSDAEAVAARLSAKIVGEVAFLGLYQLETSGRTAADLDAAVAKAKSADGVVLALANQVVVSQDTLGTRCDPLADPSYLKGANAKDYEIIGLRAAWDVIAAAGVALEPVRVGVLDEPLYTPNGEFNGKVKARGDSTKTRFTYADGSLAEGGMGHGTSVANMIGADPENGGVAGVAGVLGDKLQVSVRDIYRQGREYVPWSSPDPKDPTQIRFGTQTFVHRTFADAVRQIDEGATVINMSFGNPKLDGSGVPSAQLWRAFLTKMSTLHPNVVFVASAGNASGSLDGGMHFPGGLPLPNLITVGSVDADGKRSSFSNYTQGGDGEVTLAAPANEIMVGVGADGLPINGSGTSFAAPQVSGAVSLLRSLDPTLSAKRIKEILVETASPGIQTKDASGKDISALVPKEVGGKVLRVDQAVLKVVNDLRKKKDPAATDITLESLRALAVIDAKAVQKDPTSWTIVAAVPAVREGGTDVRIELSGSASAGGLSTRRLTAAGAVEWPLVLPNARSGASITVWRDDTKACSRLGIAGAPSASPSAARASSTPAARATLRDVVDRARTTLAWPSDGPGGGIRSAQYGQSGSYDFVRSVPYNGGTQRTVLSAIRWDSEDSAHSQFTSYVQFSRDLGPTTYRGLEAFRDQAKYMGSIPLVPGRDGMSIFKARAGLYTFEASVTCSFRSADSSATLAWECLPAVPQREIDALLEAASALGFIPAGSLK